MGFRIGFFLGVVLGAVIALLLTPQPGAEMRRVLREQARQRGILGGSEASETTGGRG